MITKKRYPQHHSAFTIMAVFLTIVVIEAASFGALSVGKKKWFVRAETLEDQKELLGKWKDFDPANLLKPRFMWTDALHPYLGYVQHRMNGADAYGFINTVSPIQKKSDHKTIIAVTGGSFAYDFFSDGMDVLLDRLKETGAFRDQEFVPIRLSAGGYKQPQQLMVLSYFLSLGAEFDILINIDGFNEAALSLSENVPYGIFPHFPRQWSIHTELLSNPGILRIVAGAMRLFSMRRFLAWLFHFPIVRGSYTANLLWETLDHGLQVMLTSLHKKELQTISAIDNFGTKGPDADYENPEALFQDIASVWERSSRQMHVLCTGNGIQYFHFLQPNQYFPGSKPLSANEKKQAFAAGHLYKEPVEKVYPYLIGEGYELRNENVNFKDLSMVFAKTEETLYADTCCHLNKEGYEKIAEVIADTILKVNPSPRSKN